MPTISSHKDFQRLLELPFCYICSKEFAQGQLTNKDHVPPKACFAYADRNIPLKLPTHVSCHSPLNLRDERIGQLISLKHGRVPERKQRRLQFSYFSNPGMQEPFVAVTNVHIREEIERWIRGFHAALYQEPLAPETRFGIETPFPVATPTNNGPVLERLRPQHFLFVRTIKANRTSNNLDRLACNNGKLIYECVWDQATNGNWLCMFALDLYGWKDLGNVKGVPAKGCAGFYAVPPESLPKTATKALHPKIELPNFDPLDPFGR